MGPRALFFMCYCCKVVNWWIWSLIGSWRAVGWWLRSHCEEENEISNSPKRCWTSNYNQVWKKSPWWLEYWKRIDGKEGSLSIFRCMVVCICEAPKKIDLWVSCMAIVWLYVISDCKCMASLTSSDFCQRSALLGQSPPWVGAHAWPEDVPTKVHTAGVWRQSNSWCNRSGGVWRSMWGPEYRNSPWSSHNRYAYMAFKGLHFISQQYWVL